MPDGTWAAILVAACGSLAGAVAFQFRLLQTFHETRYADAKAERDECQVQLQRTIEELRECRAEQTQLLRRIAKLENGSGS